MSSKDRSSTFPMIPVPEALNTVLQYAVPRTPCKKNLFDALGCILAQDVLAMEDHPPFRASMMDGYAVVASDGPGEYNVCASVTAGANMTSKVETGSVCYITTGAPIPDGADAVVQVEKTELPDINNSNIVKILEKVEIGEAIRPIGCDIQANEIVLLRGTLLCAAEIGILASIGHVEVTVFPRPKVAVMSSGDELVNPEEKPGLNKIRDSNRAMLIAAVREVGGIPIDKGIAKDDKKELETKVLDCLADADVVIFTGGVSMGQLDLFKPLLASLGTVHFGRLLMKPGKPTTFATVEDSNASLPKKMVFALPGNPVSALVSFQLLTCPCLRALMGYEKQEIPLAKVLATTTNDIRMDPIRPAYHRAGLVWDQKGKHFSGFSTGVQRSSRLLSMRSANSLMLIPQGNGFIKKGAVVDTFVTGPLQQGGVIKRNLHNENKTKKISNVGQCNCEKIATDKHAKGTGHRAKKQKKHPFNLRVCILTVSDSVSEGTSTDRSGPKIFEYLKNKVPNGVNVVKVDTKVVPDEKEKIASALKDWTDSVNPPNLIITTGGTGFSPRDVTPEAVKEILHREASGLVFAMMHSSLQHTPMAILSRPVAGVRNSSIILTLPGNPKAVSEVLSPLIPTGALIHAVRLLQNKKDPHPTKSKSPSTTTTTTTIITTTAEIKT